MLIKYIIVKNITVYTTLCLVSVLCMLFLYLTRHISYLYHILLFVYAIYYIQDGSIGYSDQASLDETGTLSIHTIQSLSSSQPLIIKHPQLIRPSFQGGNLQNIDSIQVSKLDVTGEADVRGNMYIGGSLDVSGSGQLQCYCL